MKKLFLLVLLSLSTVLLKGQTVSDVRFEQQGNKVRITYRLDKPADIFVKLSQDGGSTFSEPLKAVSGDVGTNVAPGNKAILWDALAESDRLIGTQFVFKVQVGGEEIEEIIVNGISFEMVRVKGGTFQMGATAEQTFNVDDSEKPVHSVTLSDYYIGKYEVTQAQWWAVMGTQPSAFNGDHLPVENVSWKDCKKFITKLNQMTGREFRLPTEAQWEYAARGGNQSKGYQYSGGSSMDQLGWHDSNAEGRPHPVGEKQANELGIYDMSGNVWEWCGDRFGDYRSYAQVNPTGSLFNSYTPYRVLRGGSYKMYFSNARIASRGADFSGSSQPSYGFRLCLVP